MRISQPFVRYDSRVVISFIGVFINPVSNNEALCLSLGWGCQYDHGKEALPGYRYGHPFPLVSSRNLLPI